MDERDDVTLKWLESLFGGSTDWVFAKIGRGLRVERPYITSHSDEPHIKSHYNLHCTTQSMWMSYIEYV